jgi:hypothetical protein
LDLRLRDYPIAKVQHAEAEMSDARTMVATIADVEH